MNGPDAVADEISRVHEQLTKSDLLFLRDYGDDIPIARLGDLGTAIVRNMSLLAADDVREIFRIVESAMCDGDEETKTAVATGFLESIANRLSKGAIHKASFEAYLGEESREYLIAWDYFTLGYSFFD